MAVATLLFFQGDTVLATDQAKGGSGMRWSPQTFRIADEAELLSTPRSRTVLRSVLRNAFGSRPSSAIDRWLPDRRSAGPAKPL